MAYKAKKTSSKSYSKSYYSKRPLWQWVLIYLIIGGIVYFVIYYIIVARNRSVNVVPAGSTPTYSLPGY